MVTKDMTIRQVLDLDQGTAGIFMQAGMTCLYCPHATAESLEEACGVHGVDADQLVNILNEYLTNKNA